MIGMKKFGGKLLGLALLFGAAGFATPTLAQVSDDVVKIGLIGDEGGPFSESGGLGTVQAVRMAVEDFGGKVLGKRIEIIHADHQNKPDIAAGIARRWFDVENVDAIVNLTLSAVALGVQAIATERKRTVLITGASSTELTGKSCSPFGSQWLEDTYALTAGVIKSVGSSKDKKWFFITLDNALGLSMLKDATRAIEEAGGKIVGVVRHPLGVSDFSSFLLQAQSSGADYIALANVGLDTMNSVKQAREFRIMDGGQRIIAFSTFITDIHALGLTEAQGLVLPQGFYWDDNDRTRSFSKRFFETMKKMPTNSQAAGYAAVTHYLKAIQAAGTDDAVKVNEEMRKLPVDYFGREGKVRADGRVTYDLALYQVKAPSESKGPWDYMKAIGIVRQADASRPLAESECPLVKQN